MKKVRFKPVNSQRLFEDGKLRCKVFKTVQGTDGVAWEGTFTVSLLPEEL